MMPDVPVKDSTGSLISPDLFVSPQPPETQVKLGVLASGSGSNFEALINAIANQELAAEIPVLIYNNPGIKAAARAQRWGIPTVLINHRDYKNREEFDTQVAETLKQYQVDWVVMAGWMRKATQGLLDAFPNRIINIHPSLLPSFRGVRGVEQALEAGVKITGCTVHLISLEVDAGPILIQAAVPILEDDTPETLHARIQVQEHRILPKAVTLAIAREAKLAATS